MLKWRLRSVPSSRLRVPVVTPVVPAGNAPVKDKVTCGSATPLTGVGRLA